MNKLLIFCDDLPRVTYTCKLVFSSLLGMEIRFTQSESDFRSAEGPKLSYSHLLRAYPNILPHAVMMEQGVRPQNISVEFREGAPVFFKTNVDGEFPFDLIAATLYLSSRYEEYEADHLDEHGRFDHRQSLAYKHGFLDQPLVHQYAVMIATWLKGHYPQLTWSKPEYRFESTYDVDRIFAYRGQSLWRWSLGAARQVFKGELDGLQDRLMVAVRQREDPFDVSAQLNTNLLKHESIWFVHTGGGSKHDVAADVRNAANVNWVMQKAQQAQIGLHPSYEAGFAPRLLKLEKHQLESAAGKQIVRSRQHYLRFRMPQYYQALSELEIKHDYSMGYANANGFRASIAIPYRFFDLTSNQQTELYVHPISFMDSTFVYYENQRSPEAIKSAMLNSIEIIKAHGGVLSVVWHPHLLARKPVGESLIGLHNEIVQKACS